MNNRTNAGQWIRGTVLLALACILAFDTAGTARADLWEESGTEPRTFEGYRFANGNDFKFTYPSITIYSDRNDTNPYTRLPLFVKDGSTVEFRAYSGSILVCDPIGENSSFWGAYVDNDISFDKTVTLLLDAKQDNTIMGTGYHHFGISAYNKSITTIKAGRDNFVYGGYTAVYATDEQHTGTTKLYITAERNNNIYAYDDASVNYGDNAASTNNGAFMQIESKNGNNNFIGDVKNFVFLD
ncbi:MAG: hypothetical protein ACI4NN_04335 [Pyramidobacter sp.]